MSDTVRWVIAAILVFAGIMTALFSLFFLGFFTWGCYGPSNTTAYSILYVAVAISLVSGIVPAVVLIRKVDGRLTGIVVGLSVIFTLIGNGAFICYTLNICKG